MKNNRFIIWPVLLIFLLVIMSGGCGGGGGGDSLSGGVDTPAPTPEPSQTPDPVDLTPEDLERAREITDDIFDQTFSLQIDPLNEEVFKAEIAKYAVALNNTDGIKRANTTQDGYSVEVTFENEMLYLIAFLVS